MPRTYFNPKGSLSILVKTGVRANPLIQQVYHSPAGMTWGYCGSGPHDTALSILADYYEHVKGCTAKVALQKAEYFCHMFCYECIADLKDGWSIDADEITDWLVTHPETFDA